MAFLPCHLWHHSGHRAVLSHATICRLRWTFVRAGGSQVERKPLLLKASEFQHLFEEGPTEKIYQGTPMTGLGEAQQGKILQEWARKVLEEKYPETEILKSRIRVMQQWKPSGKTSSRIRFLDGWPEGRDQEHEAGVGLNSQTLGSAFSSCQDFWCRAKGGCL